jgi:predicted nucleotidyltransferase
MTDIEKLLEVLVQHDVDFIVVGGVAAITHGAARVTYDLDVVYDRSSPNLTRLVKALAPLEAYLRGAPPGLPFRWDEKTLQRGLNFTLTTTIGDIDLLGEVTGGGNYEALWPHAQEVTVLGFSCHCVTLEKLIELKRAAGRPKDFEAIAELEALLEEMQEGQEL